MNEYYISQAGDGISTFAGKRFQRGHGFFGRLGESLIPLLRKAIPYLTPKVLDFGIEVAQNVKEGQKIGQSAKRALKRNISDIAEDALIQIKKQKGGGKRKRKAPKKSKANKKSTKQKRAVKKSSALLF